MIYRDKVEDHKKNYTILNNSIPEDARLSLDAKGMLWYLLTKPTKWRVYKSQLKQALKVSRWRFDAAFKNLVDGGYIVEENGEWNVYETPRDVGGQQNAGSQQHPDQEVVSVANIDDAGGQHEVCCLPASKCAGGQHLVITDSKDGRKEEAAPLPLSCEDSSDTVLPSTAVSESRRLKEQAIEILRYYPKEEYRDYAIRFVQDAIKTDGYENILGVTKYYRDYCREKDKKPSGAMYFYRDLEYKLYFAPDEPELSEPITKPDCSSLPDGESEQAYQQELHNLQQIAKFQQKPFSWVLKQEGYCFSPWFREKMKDHVDNPLDMTFPPDVIEALNKPLDTSYLSTEERYMMEALQEIREGNMPEDQKAERIKELDKLSMTQIRELANKRDNMALLA